MLLLASFTVQITVVFPIGNVLGASFDTVDPVQLSPNVGVPKATPVATQEAVSTFTLTAAGHVIVGLMLSVTVTI